MKNFSKILSIIICAAMLLSVLVIVGCNNDTPNPDDETTEQRPIDETRKFVLGVSIESSPYLYSKDDKLEGVCIDAVAAVMNELEAELELKINEKDQLIEKLLEGEYTGILLENDYQADLALLQQLQYTDTLVVSRQVVLTAIDSEIATPQELNDKKVGVLGATSNEVEAKAKYGEDNISAYSTNSDGLAALKAGEIDAYIVDYNSIKDLSFADEGIKVLPKNFSYKEYSVFVLLDDAINFDDINKAISALNDTHKIEAIYNEYLLEAKQ